MPTFNRLACLQETISPLLDSGVLSAKVELRVFDNASEDGTRDWLASLQQTVGCAIVRQPMNLGLEGNIISAMLCSPGQFVWTLSDHMVLRIPAIRRLVDSLPNLADGGVDIIYAQISSYGPVLMSANVVHRWQGLNPTQQSHYIFRTGNTSGMITSRRMRAMSARTVFRFSGFSYPHLGVYAHVSPNTAVLESEVLSDFLVTPAASGKTAAYNSFRSRFIGYPDAIRELRRLNPAISANAAGLTLAIGALRQDATDLLISNAPARSYPMTTPLLCFPLRATPLIVCVMLMKLMPLAIRTTLCRWMRWAPSLAPGDSRTERSKALEIRE